jgi:Fe-S cluster assembly iron-binding protein IscA
MFEVTEEALDAIRAALAGEGMEGAVVRVATVATGDGQTAVAVGFVSAPAPGDTGYDAGDLVIYVQRGLDNQLTGACLDVREGAGGARLYLRRA